MCGERLQEEEQYSDVTLETFRKLRNIGKLGFTKSNQGRPRRIVVRVQTFTVGLKKDRKVQVMYFLV